MGQLQGASVEGGSPEDEVLTPHLDALLDPFDALKPDQIGSARRILHHHVETLTTPLAAVTEADDPSPNLDIAQRGRLRNLVDGVDAATVDVAEGEVVQQVTHRADVQLTGQEFGSCFAHTGYIFNILSQ